MELFSDSAAARSILCRLGVGKVRHLEVKLLWVQRLVNEGAVLVSKVLGDENVADIGTKPLGPAVFNKHRLQLGIGHAQNDSSPNKEVNALSGRFRNAGPAISSQVLALAIALSQCMEASTVDMKTCKTGAETTGEIAISKTDIEVIGVMRGFPLQFLLICIMWIISLVGTVVATWKVSRWYHAKAKAQRRRNRPARYRDVAVQSPVTYKWWLATPRFTPLPESSHGGWDMR